MNWPNVAIHASLLPNGKVLFWGRREWNTSVNPPVPAGNGDLDPTQTIPRLWDPANPAVFTTTSNSPGYNLFCSGHTFLADGRILVVGGHIHDGQGERRATLYNFETNAWNQTSPMQRGRWYPTVVTLPNGSVLVSSGTEYPHQPTVAVQQIWDNGVWHDIVTHNTLPYYPRMHVISDGRVFLSGAVELTQLLTTGGAGGWEFLKPGDEVGSRRVHGFREYATSVMYKSDHIIYAGGRNIPIADTEIVDLGNRMAGWQPAAPMHFARVQHNATILPDGTVLVTGGTKGAGGKGTMPQENQGFNDLRTGQPIHAAELWNPQQNQWTILAEEAKDRCYHSVALLLPDATVLSAGGGEYKPDNVNANLPEDSHLDAQIFSPPYLFRGARPTIDSAPVEITYGQQFAIGTAHPNNISTVTLIRLSSVTHSMNTEQRIIFLDSSANMAGLSAAAPANNNLCPPGYYMLFILTNQGVPSVARIVRIH